MRNKKRHLPGGELGKTPEYLVLTACIQGGGGFIENQELRIPQVGAGQGDFFATRRRRDPLPDRSAVLAFARNRRAAGRLRRPPCSCWRQLVTVPDCRSPRCAPRQRFHARSSHSA